MANKLYEESSVQDIAKAIREKNGSTATYKVSQMGNAIREISVGSSEDLNDVLTEQETLLDELREVLEGKASGGGGTVETWTFEMVDGSIITKQVVVE